MLTFLNIDLRESERDRFLYVDFPEYRPGGEGAIFNRLIFLNIDLGRARAGPGPGPTAAAFGRGRKFPLRGTTGEIFFFRK